MVAPLHADACWNFWETLTYEVRTTCLPIARMRIVVEGPHRNRTATWRREVGPRRRRMAAGP